MIYDRSAEEREIFMLECFSNELHNEALATALKLFKTDADRGSENDTERRKGIDREGV